MSKEDFQKMLFTAFNRLSKENKVNFYEMIIPLIEADENNVSIS